MELRITSPFKLDLRGGFFESAHILRSQLNIRRFKILFQSSQLRCARYRNDPRLLRQQPCKRDLRRQSLSSVPQRAHQINQSLIGLAILRAEPRHAAAKIRAVELRIRVDLARQKSFAKWAERHEANPKLLQRGHHRLLRLSPEQRVLALERSNRLNRVSAADRLRACFRETEVLHLAFLNQILDRACNIFDGNVQVDTMLIEQIDGIDLQPLQRSALRLV